MAFTYEYRCPNNHITESTVHGTWLPCYHCALDGKRIYTPFHMKPMIIEPVFNVSLGKHVTSERDMKDKFVQASDAASERLGYTINYTPVDTSEPASVKVTDEGLSSDKLRTYEQRAK